MSNPLESVRVLWSVTDEQFFRIVAELFPPSYSAGAGVLLASYDPEPEPVQRAATLSRGAAPSDSATAPLAA